MIRNAYKGFTAFLNRNFINISGNEERRSMATEDLVYMERRLVETVTEHVWNNLGDIEHVPYGYETHIDKRIRNILGRFSVETNPTARHIRHTPDAFIVQQNAKVLYLVDYKCTARPVYVQWLIDEVSENAGREVIWQNIGVIHTTSYDNYVKLEEIGVKVAILTYIAYHDRNLLCDFIENIKELRRAQVRHTEIGSGKDVINFDASQMRTLKEFLSDIHGETVANSISSHIQKARMELKQEFPTNHHPRSPLARRG